MSLGMDKHHFMQASHHQQKAGSQTGYRYAMGNGRAEGQETHNDANSRSTLDVKICKKDN